jgi:uncharacterized protein
LPAFAVNVNDLPKPTGYVNDLAGVVNAADKVQLERYCTKIEQQLGVEFALVTIDSIGDQPIENFALDLSRKWGVGAKKTNQGVLLLLVIKDRKSDIETGRGVEPYITDGFAGSTLRSMRPELRNENYGAALMMGSRSMAHEIAQGKGIAFSDDLPVSRPRRTRDGGGSFPIPLVFLGIFLLIWLLGRGSSRGGRGGGGGGSFLTGMLLGSLLNSGGRDRSDGGRWGDGGGFGGDSGGGGFGGFGGGDYGGGGSSSDW